VLQAETLRAGAVMPFASYFAFCHRENHHLNDEVVTPDRVVNCLRKHGAATPIVLFPGERWTVGSPWDSDASCARWSREYASVTRSDDWLEDGPIVADEVFAMAERWNSRFAQALTPASRTILRCSGLAPRTTVRITDLGLVLDIVPGRSVKPEPATATCDVAMTSAAAARCFASLRGPEEIRFGGRMLRDNGRVERFLRLATTASLVASSSTPLLGAEVSRIGRRAVARSWAVRPAKPSSSNPSRQQSNDRKYDE
jgi:hypothetical protein